MFYTPQCKTYQQVNFTCSKTIDALLSVFVPFTCISCPAGSELVKNVVKKYTFWGEITNELIVSKCVPLPTNVTNITVISQCAEYTGECEKNKIYPIGLFKGNTKKCTMCKTGFSLPSNCTVCDSANWYFKSKLNSSRCFQGHPGCATYDLVDACSKCKSGYALINRRCDICAIDKGYRPSSGNYSICLPVILNCQNYSMNDSCTNCTTGFKLANGRCDKCDASKGYITAKSNPLKCMISIPNCDGYNSADSCSNCLTGYLLLNQRCDVCDLFNNYITSRIDLTKCFLAPPNCDAYDNNNNCV